MLDFKRDQYAFVGADDRTKSELLKDILAFANSWRHATAYILIGVEENPGHRCRVVGINAHLDDADVQQFVNSKTNRPVDLICRQVYFEGADIGIVEIPEQERPTFLNRRYGKLDENAVYIRRGSSTTIARPDEIAKMGSVLIGAVPIVAPQLSLQWADLENMTPLSSPYTVKSLVLEPTLPENTFDVKPRYTSSGSGLFRVSIPDFSLNMHINPDYSKEIIFYAFNMAVSTPLGFLLRNDSGVVARRVVFEGSITKCECEGVSIQEQLEQPVSYRHSYLLPDVGNFRERGIVPFIEEHADRWNVRIDFGDIRPRDEVFTAEPLLLGSSESCTTRLEGVFLGDNISDPISCALDIAFEVDSCAMRRSDVEPYLVEDSYESS